MEIRLDLVGLIISLSILWFLVPEENISLIMKGFLTFFFIIDHGGLFPTISLIFKEKQEDNKDE